MKLQDKVAVITGGGRGIGRALALAFADEGADIVVLARTTEEIERVAEQVRQRERRAMALTCDVAHADVVDETMATVVKQFGRIDILVNNAGGDFVRSQLVDSDPDDWSRVIEGNLLGSYHCCRAVVPHMTRQKSGKIINIGSGMGHSARAGNSAYNVAKAGMWMLTRCLALEVWQHGIEVNELIPGPVYTSLTADYFDPSGRVPPPIGESERVKQPDECVPLALFLAAHPPGGPTAQSFSLARRPLG